MPRKKSTSDQTLLDAARNVFLAEGIGASTRRIAQQAGVSEGVLFQRFGSKRALFFESMKLPPPPPSLTEATDLRELAREALDYLRGIMPAVMLVLAHPARKDVLGAGTGKAGHLLAGSAGIGQAFRALFERGVREGTLPARNYEILTSILISTLLTRALHEQIGADSAADTDPWLEKVLATMLAA